MNTFQKLLLAFALVSVCAPSIAAEAPEEFIVTGRVPGPPLWRVSKDDHVMWIFPELSPVPADLVWESDNIERVIANAQEVLYRPANGIGVTGSKLFLLNPINLVRGYRLVRRLARNPDKETLEDVLPPDLYARFSVLQDKYFPRDDDIEKMRPFVAAESMSGIIQKKAGLVGGDSQQRLRRMIERNPDIKKTQVSTFISIEVKGGYRTIADRAETAMESLQPEQELACFEAQLAGFEQIDNTRRRANAWARGDINEFRSIPAASDSETACFELWANSTEAELFDQTAEMSQKWLEAAEAALAANERSVAILGIDEVLRKDGLLSQLEARGYAVRAP